MQIARHWRMQATRYRLCNLRPPLDGQQYIHHKQLPIAYENIPQQSTSMETEDSAIPHKIIAQS